MSLTIKKMLTEEQKNKLRGAGYNNAKIVAFEEAKFGKKESRLAETGQDLKQTSGEIVNAAKSRSSNLGESIEAYRKGEQGLGRTILQGAGQAMGLGSDVIGAGLKGAVKVALSQDTETSLKGGVESALKPIMQSQVAQDIMAKYKTLDPKTQRDLGAALGAGSLITDVVGIGATAKGVKAGFQTAKPLVKSGINKIKTAVGETKQSVSTAISSKLGKAKSPLDNAIEAITPKTKDLTPTEYEMLLGQNKITPKTPSSPASYILSESEKVTALKYEKLLQGKDPVKNSINVIDEIARKDASVGDFLRKNNGIYNSGELKNYILKSLEGVDDVMVDEAKLIKLKNTLTDGFIRNLPKNDMETLWKSRKAFDRSIEKVFSGSPTLQNTIKKEFRNSIQDFIASKTPEGVYKKSMSEMRELFNLHDIIATKATKEKSLNAIQNWIKNNPTKAKVIVWGSGLVGASQVYQVLK